MKDDKHKNWPSDWCLVKGQNDRHWVVYDANQEPQAAELTKEKAIESANEFAERLKQQRISQKAAQSRNPEKTTNATGLWVKVGPKNWKIKRIDNWPLLQRELQKRGKTLEDVQYKPRAKANEQGRSLPTKEHYDNLERRYPREGWKEKGEENELHRFVLSVRKSFHEHEKQVMKEAQEQARSI